MMTLNICIESYGAAVHVIDSMLSTGLDLRPNPRTAAGDLHGLDVYGSDVPGSEVSSVLLIPAATEACTPDGEIRPNLPGSECAADFDSQVQTALANLDHGLAQALWLVDVCGCSYDEAAAEARTSRQAISERVGAARRSILLQLAAN